MARIRTIKPEFPHSESMGRISRDARLLFIMLWTICDDSGRTRGNSRMLASLLYPYDDDANKHMGKWLDELEKESCIVRYQVEGQSYLEVCNWLKHQKIDKPSASKIPPFDEHSSNPREDSRSLTVGMEGNGMDQGKEGKVSVANKSATNSQLEILLSLGVQEQHAKDWLQVRAKKKAPSVSQTVIDGIVREAAKASITFADAIRICAEKSWQGFDADWVMKNRSKHDAQMDVVDQVFGRANHGNDRQIIDITPSVSIESDEADIPKAIAGLR